MKKYLLTAGTGLACFIAGFFYNELRARGIPQNGYLLEQEKDLAKPQTGPHGGGGTTTGFDFFAGAADCNLVFRKRALHPGSAIGYHLQKEDEIYYVLSGTGEMTMNGKTFAVGAGDAVLTRPGSSHGLKQTGNQDLVIIINYEKKPPVKSQVTH